MLTAAYNGWSSRSAALGVLNESHGELERFLTAGIDEQARARIGELPHGRGVLGVLIEHPQPLRLVDVSEHPSSYGFPAGHPPMRGFLGVPVVIHGQVWGNLYLTEKAEGEFTDRDEEAAVILAQWAAIAIENARLYALSEQRRELSEKASRGLRVSRDVAVAVGGEVALDRVLELIVERALALVDARSVLMWLRDREELILAAQAVKQSVAHVEQEIANLRAIITDLRPASLDELGLRAALESLFEQYDERGTVEIESELSIFSTSDRHTRLEPELENTVYRLVQEALTNVNRHAHASIVHVRVSESAGAIEIEVQDDGTGFDSNTVSRGYGVAGMRERTSLAGGSLSITSSERGTTIRACLPVRGSAGPA